MKRKRSSTRMTKTNGAELLLMGANPTKREAQKEARERATRIRGARLNPIVNSSFSEEQKLALGRMGIKWTCIQNPSDVRKARRALKDAAKIRARFGRQSNPLPVSEQREKAQEIYSGFHHAEPKSKLILDEPHIPEGVYPELGLLLLIAFKPTNPNAEEHYEKNYVCEQENVHVIGSLDRDQLHFAGGDQRISTNTLKYFGWDGVEQNFQLGEARKIIYLARKYHEAVAKNARGQLVEWVHSFGEETGKKPRLYYDTVAHRIYLKHGEYSIKDEGIVN
jgi:hypothetical protein